MYHGRLDRAELINTLTHAVGFLLALGSVPVLITLAAMNGSARHVSIFSVYSATLILMYLASTLYHAAPPGRGKQVLQALDHMAIYLLIAGTYTPFLLVGMDNLTGWILFYVLWGLALVGIGVKIFFTSQFDLVSTLAYLLMGWAGLAAIGPLYEALPTTAFSLVIAGGLSYTFGSVFYVWERLPHNHGIWHVFCLTGSVLQFIAVFYLLP